MDVPSITYNVRKKSWIVTHDYYFADGLTLIKIPAGFSFDLASIPRFLWVIIPPFGLSILAPLIHDFIYNHDGIVENRIYTRRETDKLFKNLMNSEGVSHFRTSVAYLAVRAIGWWHWFNIKESIPKWFVASKIHTNITK